MISYSIDDRAFDHKQAKFCRRLAIKLLDSTFTMSTLEDFLYNIATEMGRPKQSMDPILKVSVNHSLSIGIYLLNTFCSLRENWYDSIDTLRGIDDAAWDKMKVPARLVELIKQKLTFKQVSSPQPQATSPGSGQRSSNFPGSGRQIQQEEAKKQEQLIPLERLMKEKTEKHKRSEWKTLLERLRKEIGGGDNFERALNILEKVTANVINDPTKEQFRTLKVESNQKLKEAIGVYPTALEALILVTLLPTP